MAKGERTPLLGEDEATTQYDFLGRVYDFIEARTPLGKVYEALTACVIIINTLCFIISTMDRFSHNPEAKQLFDTVEVLTVALFSFEYIVRISAVTRTVEADGSMPYIGCQGRLKWAFTSFWSWVDLMAILPYFVDLMVPEDLPASQVIRLLRLLRVMKHNAAYVETFATYHDIFQENEKLLVTSGFVALTTWIVFSSLFYVAERHNPDMIWEHPGCSMPSSSALDDGGRSGGGGMSTELDLPQCTNRYQSITSSAYFTLWNLLGEVPLIDNYTPWGRVLGILTALIGVAAFAIATGVFGSGFEDMIARRKEKNEQERAQARAAAVAAGESDGERDKRDEGNAQEGSAGGGGGDADYNRSLQQFLAGKSPAGKCYEWLTFACCLLSVALVMLSTVPAVSQADDYSNDVIDVGSGGGGGMSSTTQDIVNKQGRLLRAQTPTTSDLASRDRSLSIPWIPVGGSVSISSSVLFESAVGLEIILAAFFMCDYILRWFAASPTNGGTGRTRYMMSIYGAWDLLSFLPQLVQILACGVVGGACALSSLALGTKAGAIRTLRLLRMLKAERYVRGFAVFDDIIRANGDVLIVSGFVSLLLLVFSSAGMYYAERNNPDPDMAKYYKDVPTSMWLTLLNLTGESPLADYTGWGRIISGLVGIVAVGAFAIPVGLLGAGFEEWVTELGDSKEGRGSGAGGDGNGGRGGGEEGSALLPNGSVVAKEENGGPLKNPDKAWTWREKLYHFVEGRPPRPRTGERGLLTWLTRVGPQFTALVLLTIFVSVTSAIFETTDGADGYTGTIEIIEAVATAVFTVEYVLRVMACPEAEIEAGAVAGDSSCFGLTSRFRYMVSMYALIDALSTFPYYLTLVFPVVDQYDGYLRMLRLLRLLKMDKYVPSISLIDDVFRLKARGLTVSGFTSGVMWVFFASWLYLAEHKDDTEADCLTQAQRFSSIPNSMQYDLILLTGDYPLIDFTVWGKVINVLQIVVAVGVVAVPSGLIAGGFTELLEARRDDEKQRRKEAALVLQRQVRGYLARKRFREAVEGARVMERERQLFLEQRREAMTGGKPILKAMMAVEVFMSGGSRLSRLYLNSVMLLVVLNVMAVIVESEPAVDKSYSLQEFFDMFEAVSVLVFTLDILLRIFYAPVSASLGRSRWAYLTSFYGIVDLATVLPWYFEMYLTSTGVDFDASVFRVFRVLRLLQLEDFVSAFTLLDDVWRGCSDVLAATGLLALIVWVASAFLFWVFERNNECLREKLTSIPMAMYYVAVFLDGEWGMTDFTWPGKIICMLLCMVGIALFAIPVGTVFESFSNVLAEGKDGEDAETANEEEEEKEEEKGSQR